MLKFLNSYKFPVLVGIALGVIAVVIFLRSRPVTPVDITPPERPEAIFMLPDDYVYRQDDRRWSNERIGETTDSMAAYGCTIASVAMAASNLLGQEVTPIDLERRLSAEQGFTDRGWLIWDKVSPAMEGKISAKYYNHPSHEDIQACMTDGGYPIIKIKLNDLVVHWVSIVGQTKSQYLIRDPLSGTPKDPPIKLSERSSTIYGVRCISRSE